MALEYPNSEQTEKLIAGEAPGGAKALADEEASELSDDALCGVSGGNTYTSMDGYTVDDGLDPQTDETIRLYLES